MGPEEMAQAYGNTAKLYGESYGEPFHDSYTIWLPSDVTYPLAAPDSPLGSFLHVCAALVSIAHFLEAPAEDGGAGAGGARLPRACRRDKPGFSPTDPQRTLTGGAAGYLDGLELIMEPPSPFALPEPQPQM
ncbi:hypothetical protein GPECTOR_30g231 [Gonium pectorale]|uniref:Uncharacterized protein n=1 Tax=Gonium pectorale TaxID=33097 RepID=A0A150GEY3_GONPE|nr:hypothetical protein GPECTOR_30g231 [Gonium pectorale]|eukprot:KXZ48135.1 hypothetical protein GPECTOR_30g231 [Gonium pectorale]